MKKANSKQRLVGAIGLVGIAFLAIPFGAAFASGTVGGGGAPPSAQRQGQAVYTRSIACRTCMFPGGLTSKELVAQAIAKIQSGDIALSASDKTAVLAYINRRFGRI